MRAGSGGPPGGNGLAISNRLATYGRAVVMLRKSNQPSVLWAQCLRSLIALFIAAQRVHIRDWARGLLENRIARFPEAMTASSVTRGNRRAFAASQIRK